MIGPLVPRFVFVNGRYVPYTQAVIHVEDRGYQLADGVYEVLALVNTRLIDADWHFNRLEFSLREINLEIPYERKHFCIIIRELMQRNRIVTGLIYLQISRGKAPRQFQFPASPGQPSIVVMVKRFEHKRFLAAKEKGVKAITMVDQRWRRPDIKSVSLLASVLAKQAAFEADSHEALLYNEQGYVTEGSSSNLWIVTTQGTLQTHPANGSILNGITRLRLMHLAEEKGILVLEKPFTLEELYQAQEVFTTGSASFVLPIIQVDGILIGDGKPGALTMKLQRYYLEFIHDQESL